MISLMFYHFCNVAPKKGYFIFTVFFAVEITNKLKLELETLSAVQVNKNQILSDLNVNNNQFLL